MSQQSEMEDKIIIAIAADMSSSSINTDSSSNTFNDSISEIINSTNESDASSSSEEACDILLFPLYQLLMYGRRRSKVQGFLDTVHLYTDAVFKEHFRLQRHIAYLQIDMLQQSDFIPSHSSGMLKISAEWSFLIFLWYLANTEPLRTLGDRFDVSISSIFRVIHRVVEWLLSRLDEEIKWPEGNDIFVTSQKFEAKRGIRKCIGAIDCTHIAIRQPVDHPRDYCNRKRFFSIVLQGVVDADMKFTNIYCGEPGSLHDARVLKRSLLYDTAQNDMESIFPNKTCIIGDSAYPLLPWLVPPFRDNGHLTAQQSEFNFLHSSTRMAVERAFGYLKGRFRRLRFLELLNIQFIPELITAACIMHNIAIKENDENEFFADDNDFLIDNAVDENYEIYNLHVNRSRNEVIDRRMQMFHELLPE